MPKLTEQEQKQAWLAFASSAICGSLANPSYDDAEDAFKDAMDFADDALKQYAKRFGKGTRTRRSDEEDE